MESLTLAQRVIRLEDREKLFKEALRLKADRSDLEAATQAAEMRDDILRRILNYLEHVMGSEALRRTLGDAADALDHGGPPSAPRKVGPRSKRPRPQEQEKPPEDGGLAVTEDESSDHGRSQCVPCPIQGSHVGFPVP